MKKVSILAAAIAVALTGCGSDSSIQVSQHRQNHQQQPTNLSMPLLKVSTTTPVLA